MQVRVLFFATLRERVGTKEASLDVPDAIQIRAFKKVLAEHYPTLADLLPTALVSVNRDFAFDEDTIPAGAEVALFPPVSGG